MSNVSDELEHSILRFVHGRAELRVIPDAELEPLCNRIAENFVADRQATWWWTALSTEVEVDDYGQDDGLVRLRNKLDGLPDPLVLVITDDESPPWLAVRGSLEALLEMVSEHSYFEFLVTDDSASWVLFDTHHNCLIFAKR